MKNKYSVAFVVFILLLLILLLHYINTNKCNYRFYKLHIYKMRKKCDNGQQQIIEYVLFSCFNIQIVTMYDLITMTNISITTVKKQQICHRIQTKNN